MEIRMKTLMAGPNGSRHPGERCTVEADEAEMLINGGYAEAIDEGDGKKASDENGEQPAEAIDEGDGKKAKKK
jgi:hypothetical protein